MLKAQALESSTFAGAFSPGDGGASSDEVRVAGRPVSLATGRYLSRDELAQSLSRTDISGACRDLDGSFCLAVTSADGSSLHLVADPVGTCPILYSLQRDGEATRVLYATSWEDLLRLLSRERRRPTLNAGALAKFMFSGYAWGDDTLLSGVYNVPPGTVLTIDRQGCSITPYYAFRRRPRRGHDPIPGILRALEQSLSRYRDSRVLLTLSGGWDSRTLLALAGKVGLPLEAITLGYAYDQPDDLGVAVGLSRIAGVSHNRWQLKPEEFAENADWLITSSGGLCDALVSYSDGLTGYRRVAEDFDIVLRGDECFGWGTTSVTVTHARKQLGLYHLPPDGVHAPELQDLFLEELSKLDFARSSKRPDDVKNEFYWRHRLPRYIMPVAGWQRLVAPGVHIEHPCLSRRVLDEVACAPRGWLNDKRCEKELLRNVSPALYSVDFPTRKCWYLTSLFREYATLREYLLDHVTAPSILDDFLPLDGRRRLADALDGEDPPARLARSAPALRKRRFIEHLKTVPFAGTLLSNLYALKADALAAEGLSWLIRAMCVKVFMDRVTKEVV